MKKFLLLAAAAVVLYQGKAANVIVDGIVYDIGSADNTATVGRQNNPELISVIIPDKISVDDIQYTVSAIGDWAFYGCRKLTDITIPETVTASGSFAFASCDALSRISITSLEAWCAISWKNGYSNPLLCGHTLYIGGEPVESLVIPETISVLKESAFNGGDFTSVTFNNNLTAIGNLTFYECTKLEKVELPESVTSVGTSAFSGCTALSSICLPSTLTEISGYCFENCRALVSIDIPTSVKAIGNGAFAGCESLQNVYIHDIAAWCNIEMAGETSNPLMCADRLYLDGGIVTALDIPAGITTIPDNRFNSLSDIVSVSFPASLQTLGSKAFQSCKFLTHISFASEGALSSIGESCFEECTSLNSVVLPPTTASIGPYAFYGCRNLQKASLPTALTALADGVFGECTALTDINFPEGITKIGFGAFFGCSALGEVRVPDTTVSLGKSAFNGCSALTTVTLGSGLKSLSAYTFGSCNALENIYAHPSEPPVAQSTSFSTYTPVLWVTDGASAKYADADIWKEFGDRRTFDAGVSSTVGTRAKEPEFYRLDGTKVDTERLTPGLYIRIVNSQSSKIIVR